MGFRRVVLACGAVATTIGWSALGCADDFRVTSGTGANASTASHTGGTGGAMTGQTTVGTFSTGTSSTSSGIDPACANQTTQADRVPLDIFIMLDQSASMNEDITMGGTKWKAVTDALKAFVSQSGLTDVAVGLQYFGLPNNPAKCHCSDNSTCTMPGDSCDVMATICVSCESADSCDPSEYAAPDVEISALPGVAMPIVKSIDSHTPASATPTYPALKGAIQHAKEWATAHPDHVVIDILATDGNPNECDSNQADIEGVAAAGVNSAPSIPTFVIGVGENLTALNGIAAAGGTQKAFIVDPTKDVNKQFTDALATIQGAALGCNYKIPLPMVGDPDFTKINVEYTATGSSTPEVIPQVANKAACPAMGDAWYYDDPAMPTQILLCDETCAKLSADNTGKVSVVIGCTTIVK